LRITSTYKESAFLEAFVIQAVLCSKYSNFLYKVLSRFIIYSNTYQTKPRLHQLLLMLT
jgi:hypothetical protein